MYKFKVMKVNVFDVIGKADAICVTTNGVVKSNHELVMGAGIAKQFAEMFPNMPSILGRKVKQHGNYVYHVSTLEVGDANNTTHVLSFPTKHNYKDKSDIELIKRSAIRLVKWANANSVVNKHSIYIPSPGTGLGGLSKDEVYSVLNNIFDERFVICTK